MNSEVVRWLVDVENGELPRAFECLLQSQRTSAPEPCGKITRTITGMRCHLIRVHAFSAQDKLFPEAESEQADR